MPSARYWYIATRPIPTNIEKGQPTKHTRGTPDVMTRNAEPIRRPRPPPKAGRVYL